MPSLSAIELFTVLLWGTSTFWIPLLVVVFSWKVIQGGLRGYDPSLWSAVFALGMYVVATFTFASVAQLQFLKPLGLAMFWVALFVWVLTCLGMGRELL
jgi:tellurite resistance protein TehA-like permease